MSTAPSLRKSKVAVGDGGDVAAAAVCDHCGDALAGLKVVRKPLGSQMQSFCCLGCGFIAEQLFLAHASSQDRAVLDVVLTDALAPRAAPASGPLQHLQVQVQGMVCAACGLLVEHRLRRTAGVAHAHVDFGSRRAYVSLDPALATPATVADAIRRAGYRTSVSAADERRRQRVDLLRLLLAWLAMMQVMMLAVPSYVAAPADIAPDIQQLLRIAQLVLTFPVLLFCALPIGRAAASQVRSGSIGMDLPIVIGLGAAFCASAWATWIAQGPVYFDSITMFVALVLGARWLQTRALAQAYAHVDAAHRQSRLTALRLRAWPASTVSDPVAADELAVGEFVLVPAGETVAADGVVRAGTSSVSQAWLTGEATPLDKFEGAPVLAGSVNLDQPLVLEVTRAGEATSLAALRRMVDEAGRQRPRIVELANRVAVVFLWVVLGVTVLTVAGWLLVDPAQALPNAIAVLVATCPCALSLAAPAALGAAQAALARRGVLTARVAALETLAQVDVFALDKTGTLTAYEPALLRVVALRNCDATQALALAAAMETLSAHPFAKATVAAARAQGLAIAAAHDPVITPSAGVEATVGGVRLRLGKSDYALGLAQADPLPVAARLLQRMEREQVQAASMIVLADASGPLALLVFGEALRADARALVAGCSAQGVATLLISGDRRAPVERVARDCGIARAFAHQTPDSKRQLIAQLQRERHTVAMLGDGMNDAPVIAQADVSLALAGGSQLAQARADFIVLHARLADVAATFFIARRAMRIVRQNLGWALVYNVAVIPLAALGYVTPVVAAVGMAASSALVVGNALRVNAGRRSAPEPGAAPSARA